MTEAPHRSGRQQKDVPRPERAASGGALLRSLGKFVRRYTARNERLELCETLSLGGRRSVALIECDGQRFLAGMSANGVETLVAMGEARLRGDLR